MRCELPDHRTSRTRHLNRRCTNTADVEAEFLSSNQTMRLKMCMPCWTKFRAGAPENSIERVRILSLSPGPRRWGRCGSYMRHRWDKKTRQHCVHAGCQARRNPAIVQWGSKKRGRGLHSHRPLTNV